MSRSPAHLLLPFALGLTLACGAAPPPDDGVDPRSGATLRVENRGFNDATVYVVRTGERTRLGTVTGNSSQTFTIPAHLLEAASPLQFLADPIGGRSRPVSESLSVRPGEQVTLVIPPR